MTAYTEYDVEANGICAHYYRSTPSPDAPGIVLVHGLTGNGMNWVRVADALRDRYDVILPDTRGHGLSDAPESGYTVEERAADIAALIDALGLDRPVLIGHSMGGQAAAAAAALYPDKVCALVLEDPAWFEDEPQESRERDADEKCAILREQHKMSGAALIEQGRQENPDWHADELGPRADGKLQMREHALRALITSVRPGWQAFARRIQCPTLLITGDPNRYIIVRPERCREVIALNPRIREANIPGAAHCIHRDQFDAYMRAVEAFLIEVHA
jgi:pimeloyl-ACP methyl ester carboxylesterase